MTSEREEREIDKFPIFFIPKICNALFGKQTIPMVKRIRIERFFAHSFHHSPYLACEMPPIDIDTIAQSLGRCARTAAETRRKKTSLVPRARPPRRSNVPPSRMRAVVERRRDVLRAEWDRRTGPHINVGRPRPMIGDRSMIGRSTTQSIEDRSIGRSIGSGRWRQHPIPPSTMSSGTIEDTVGRPPFGS